MDRTGVFVGCAGTEIQVSFAQVHNSHHYTILTPHAHMVLLCLVTGI